MKWEEGMLAVCGEHSERLIDGGDWDFLGDHGGTWVPALDDRGTQGCLRGQMQDLWGPTAHFRYVERRWVLFIGDDKSKPYITRRDYGEALMAALASGPKKLPAIKHLAGALYSIWWEGKRVGNDARCPKCGGTPSEHVVPGPNENGHPYREPGFECMKTGGVSAWPDDLMKGVSV